MGITGGITALSTLFSLSETRKEKKKTEASIEEAATTAEDEATAAAKEITDDETAAEKKRKDRLKELATGGRAAQIKTSPLGVTDQAGVAKKTLLGN